MIQAFGEAFYYGNAFIGAFVLVLFAVCVGFHFYGVYKDKKGRSPLGK